MHYQSARQSQRLRRHVLIFYAVQKTHLNVETRNRRETEIITRKRFVENVNDFTVLSSRSHGSNETRTLLGFRDQIKCLEARKVFYQCRLSDETRHVYSVVFPRSQTVLQNRIKVSKTQRQRLGPTTDAAARRRTRGRAYITLDKNPSRPTPRSSRVVLRRLGHARPGAVGRVLHGPERTRPDLCNPRDHIT